MLQISCLRVILCHLTGDVSSTLSEVPDFYTVVGADVVKCHQTVQLNMSIALEVWAPNI